MRTRDKVKHLWLASLFAALPVFISFFIVSIFYPTGSHQEDLTAVKDTITFLVNVFLFYSILSYD